MSERIERRNLTREQLIELRKKTDSRHDIERTRRVTVKVPTITMSHSSKRLREKNRKIVKSLEKDNDKLFSF